MDEIQNTSATLAGENLECFNIFLVLADRLIDLVNNIQNMSATLLGNKFELCLALIITFIALISESHFFLSAIFPIFSIPVGACSLRGPRKIPGELQTHQEL